VVDDEAHVRDITRRQLEAHGYRVFTARSGSEALACYGRHRQEIAAVLTDLMMPGMDGKTTIKELRRLDPAVRVVAVSGLPPSTEAAGAGGTGAQVFLQKPYTAQALLQTVRGVLAAP
jgi:CheY-like chemotaxis protein